MSLLAITVIVFSTVLLSRPLLRFWRWLWQDLYQDPTDDDAGRDLYEDAEDRRFGL